MDSCIYCVPVRSQAAAINLLSYTYKAAKTVVSFPGIDVVANIRGFEHTPPISCQ
jgi:hypothetical protein